MSFRKYGGLDYSQNNNIVRNNVLNSVNFSNTNIVGQLNSKTISNSHIDLSGNSLLNVGNIYFSDGTSQSTASTSSDYRIKINVENLDNTFIVDKLRPVIYNKNNSNKKEIGLIAHEVQEIYPYLVNGEKDGENIQSLNYIGLIPVLIKEIQELKTRIVELEYKNKIDLNSNNSYYIKYLKWFGCQ